ncbi:unnamed protein product [Parnassius apollo]|uniref:(apollo) hypothetical protein n=1 Tax=Parnassius apollo TaxID=110799 RepID=A0A8S3WW38_PARAO|nr:unnamed protein product [Parnassius apollo]
MMLWISYVVTLVACASTFSKTEQVASHSPYFTVQNIQSEGYHAEAHHAVTNDGYKLEMHRIPYRRYENKGEVNRPIVFCMHGLLASSNSYIYLGPQYSMGYHLADAGYDVWIGNARGTKNSRHHITLDPDSSTEKFPFFDFSFEEIGMYDIATMVDYVLNYTGRPKLHYIGYSQGGTTFLVLNSMRPEYNEKFISAHLLACVGYQNHFPSSQIARLSRLTDSLYSLTLSMGLVELFSPNSSSTTDKNVNNSSFDLCSNYASFQSMCKMVVDNIQLENVDPDWIGGAAVKQIAHYGQNIRDKAFTRWNYGLEKNVKLYGSETPPSYNLSLITVNTTLHYATADTIVDERDVLAMANDMPVTSARKVKRENFSHIEFTSSKDTKDLITDYIIEAIAMAQKTIANVMINSEKKNQEDNEIEDESSASGSGYNPGNTFKLYLTALSLLGQNFINKQI